MVQAVRAARQRIGSRRIASCAIARLLRSAELRWQKWQVSCRRPATAADHPVRVLGRVDLPLGRLRRRHAEVRARRRLAVVHLDAVDFEWDAGM